MKSTIYLKISSCLLLLVLLSGCCLNSDREVWPRGFPVRAQTIKYARDPVQGYNKTNKTYIVTSEFMKNSLNNKIFIDEVMIWKNENGIR